MNCDKVSEVETENMKRTVYQTDNMRILKITQIENNSTFFNEFYLLYHNKLNWEKELKPAGWFSKNILGDVYDEDYTPNCFSLVKNVILTRNFINTFDDFIRLQDNMFKVHHLKHSIELPTTIINDAQIGNVLELLRGLTTEVKKGLVKSE